MPPQYRMAAPQQQQPPQQPQQQQLPPGYRPANAMLAQQQYAMPQQMAEPAMVRQGTAQMT